MPSPTGLVVKKGSKILSSLPSRDAVAGVGDLDHDVVALEDHGAVAVEVAVEADVAGGDADLAAAGHGVAGVDDQVHDHLLELALVDADRRQVAAVLDPQRHVLAQQAAQQVGELGERVPEVETVGRTVCLREKASSLRTRSAARLAVWRICIRSPCSTSPTSWRSAAGRSGR